MVQRVGQRPGQRLWQWVTRSVQRLRQRLRFHAWPLGALAVAILLGQAATLTQQPLVGLYPDTASYMVAAQNIAQSFQLAQPFREPGYPLFLILVFQLTGGVDYTAAQICTHQLPSASCSAILFPVVIAQAFLAVAASLGSYLLVYRLTGRRLFACLIACYLSINLYLLAWERSILSETLSATWLVLVFLGFERFVRQPRLWRGLLLGGLLGGAVLIRPSNLFLPFVLLGLALLRLLWTRELRRQWRAQWLPLAAAGVTAGALLLGYMTLNSAVNSFFGLSYASNITLLGKVIEYHMQDLPVDPQYRDVQTALHAFVRVGGKSPWGFVSRYPQISGRRFVRAGDYARSVISHNPGIYVEFSLRDLLKTWRAPPVFYALEGASSDGTLPPDDRKIPPGLNSYFNQGHKSGTPAVNEPLWVTALLDISTLEQLAFVVLPILLLFLVARLWRRSDDTKAFMLLAILGAVLGTMTLASFGNYDEFYRIRMPMDWGMIAVSGIVGLEALARLARRAARARPGGLPRLPGDTASPATPGPPEDVVAAAPAGDGRRFTAAPGDDALLLSAQAPFPAFTPAPEVPDAAVIHAAYRHRRLRTEGMEFASEMVINAAKAGLRIVWRPIAYYSRLGERIRQAFDRRSVMGQRMTQRLGQRAVQRVTRSVQRLRQRLRFHAWPLGALAVAILLGQAATLTQQPLVSVYSDSASYASAAQRIVQSFGLVQPFREPGYPLFLTLVLQLTGGADYAAAKTCTHLPPSAFCSATFLPVVLAQALLSVVGILGSYLLVYRLTGRRLFACLIACYLSINLYLLAWERSILSETLSATWLVLVFLGFERFVRQPRLWRGLLLGGLLGGAVLIRPDNLFLPVVLLGLAGLRLLWVRELRAQWRRQWRPLAAASVVTGSLLLGYMTLNSTVNGFFGLSYAHNITLLGKVIEYHMQDLPVDPQYRDMQTALDAFVRAGGINPGVFRAEYPQYADGEYALVGDYARAIIVGHLGTYVKHSLGDLLRTWRAHPVFYALEGAAPDGSLPPDDRGARHGLNSYLNANHLFGTPPINEPLWVTGLLNISTLEQASFLLLPLLLLLLGVWLWRRPKDTEAFLLLAVLGAVLGTMTMAAFGNYAEFYRIRMPMDWGLIAVGGIVLLEGLARLARRGQRGSRGPRSPHNQPLPPMGAGEGAAAFSLPQGAAAPHDAPMHLANLVPSAQRRDQLASASGGDALRRTVGQVAGQADSSVGESEGGEGSEGSEGSEGGEAIEVSIVLPCLNEEEAIGLCLTRLQAVIAQQGLRAEIVVVDNASTDRTAQIARAHGARVVEQPTRGYGHAYLAGLAAARGRYLVMADADNTYDFREIPAFLAPLRAQGGGYDLVMGNRFAGRMARGAMSWSHRYLGNPLLSGLLNLFFRTGVRDAHCGLRAFTHAAYRRMRLRTGGMEFASEMVINAAKAGLKIAERPIAYYPRVGQSKLHTVRDGWRHLRFLLLYSPTHLFLIPGALLLLGGLATLALLTPGPVQLVGHAWDIHTMIFASLAVLIGSQISLLGLCARFFSLSEELDGERDRLLGWLSRRFTLERGLVGGGLLLLPGLGVDAAIFWRWVAGHFGPLSEVRPAIFATTLLALGTQLIFGSFFLSLLQFKKSLHVPPPTSPTSPTSPTPPTPLSSLSTAPPVPPGAAQGLEGSEGLTMQPVEPPAHEPAVVAAVEHDVAAER